MLDKKMLRKRILLVEGDDRAKPLIRQLIKQGNHVTVIDSRIENCEKFAEIPKLSVVHGDGSEKATLEVAGAEETDIVIALSEQDEENLIVCEVCKKYFRVKKTIALLSDFSKKAFFYQMGIDNVICAMDMVLAAVEEDEPLCEMENPFPKIMGGRHIVEMPVRRGARAAGRKVLELSISKETLILCIVRGDKNIVPSGETTILEGDLLLILASGQEEIDKMKEVTEKEQDS